MLLLSLFVRRATFMETLQLYNFCRFGPRGLGFGTVFTSIILLWIRNFKKIGPPQPPQENQKTKKKWIFTMGNLADALS